MDRGSASKGRHAAPRQLGGVEGNSRLTGSLAAVLLLLLFIEGVSIVSIGRLLTLHIFVGVLLIPPALYKIGSAGWRFSKYYRRAPEYQRKGPPVLLLRVLGPAVVVLTGLVLASGVALILVHGSWRSSLLFVHQASFIIWFGAMAIHVLGHLGETIHLAPLDWLRRTRSLVGGSSGRRWLVASSLALGFIAALAFTPLASGWFNQPF